MSELIKLTDRPTPETDAARNEILQWHDKHGHERDPMEVLHTFEHDPRPDDGWTVARRLEQQRDAAVDALASIPTLTRGGACELIHATLAAIKETK